MRNEDSLCRSKNHWCGIWQNKSLVCIEPIEREEEIVNGEKFVKFITLKACSKNSSGKSIEVENDE